MVSQIPSNMVAFLTVAASFLVVVPAVLSEPLSPGALYARQLPSGFNPGPIPQGCVTTCETFSNTFTGTCSDLSCLCTNAIANGIKNCLECAVKVGVPDLNQTVVDQTISGFSEACSEGGFPISVDSGSLPSSPTGPNTTISNSGGSGSGSGSSGGATTTSGGSGSASTNTAPSDSLTGGKSPSAAIAGYSISTIALVFASVLSGVALL